VPTLDSQGIKGFETAAWYGIAGPAGVPKAVVALLNQEIVKMVKSEEFRQRVLNVGLEPLLNSPEDFAKIIAADSAQWNGIMPGLNLKQQ